MYYIVWQFIIECTVCKKKKCKLSHSVLLMFTQHPNFLGSRVIQRLKYMRDPVNKDVESNNSSSRGVLHVRSCSRANHQAVRGNQEWIH